MELLPFLFLCPKCVIGGSKGGDGGTETRSVGSEVGRQGRGTVTKSGLVEKTTMRAGVGSISDVSFVVLWNGRRPITERTGVLPQ